MRTGDLFGGALHQVHLMRRDERAETVLGDGKMGGVDIAGDNTAEVACQFRRHLARSCTHIVRHLGQAIMRFVVVVYGLVEWLVVMRAGCEIIVPIILVVVGALEKVGSIFGGGHLGGGFNVHRCEDGASDGGVRPIATPWPYAPFIGY